jgi:hypothetical protein
MITRFLFRGIKETMVSALCSWFCRLSYQLAVGGYLFAPDPSSSLWMATA